MNIAQRNLEATAMSGVRESVTLLNCLQEPDCEAVSLLFAGTFLSFFFLIRRVLYGSYML